MESACCAPPKTGPPPLMEVSMGTPSAHQPWMAPQPCGGPKMAIKRARRALKRGSNTTYSPLLQGIGSRFTKGIDRNWGR
uniref:Uncharacterized protein n=1 Tax=Arundo donax TaxID=35708 RepID=A0A0A9A6H3_ARUDO